MLLKRINALWHPECYHGWGKSKRFFEGWYYKIISADQKAAFAIIPGIAMDEQGQKQVFIQVLDGKKCSAVYHRFDESTFDPHPKIHHLKIRDNTFSLQKMTLHLPGLQGEVTFDGLNPWSNSLFSPGIMGPFSFVPLMECYHGILSMDHRLTGQLIVDGKPVNFSDGRGYMEKDWGHSFPEGYIWMQSNHFSEKGTSLKASIAKIPWLGSSFIGHIAGVLHQGQLIEFTTYNGTKLVKCNTTPKTVMIVMENKKYRLEIQALREKATGLAAPIAGFMDGRIEESMNAKINVLLFDKRKKKPILEDQGTSAGIEVAGRFQLLEK
ncbi:MAG: tocopherol cyclase family protein [Flavobacteriaceae bacterium]